MGSARHSRPAPAEASAPTNRTGSGSLAAAAEMAASRPASAQKGIAVPCQPPRKNATVKAQTANASRNSAMYQSANFMPLYSVWKPATSSDSASGMSKGVRLTSATPLRKNVRQPAKPQGVATNHRPACASTMPVSESVPVTMMIATTDRTPGTSYEMSCATERIAPRTENLLRDAQPPMKIAYEPMEETAKT